MAGVLSRLTALIPGFGGSAPTPPPPNPTAEARLALVKSVKAQLEHSARKARPFGGEKAPANWGGPAGKVWFLPYRDATTQDSPEIRAAMRLMRRDGYVKAAWEPQILAVESEDSQVQPSEEGNPDAEEQARFVQTVFDDYTVGGVGGLVRAICAPLGSDGFSLAEKVWEVAERGRAAGKIVLSAAKAKDPNYLRVMGDRFWNVEYVRPFRQTHQPEFPIEDFLYSRYLTVFDEPLGEAAFRPAYGPYWMRDTVRKLRLIHHEKKMAGMLAGYYSDPADQPVLEAALNAAKSNTWITIPEGVRVEALTLSNASEPDYKSFDESLRDEIVQAIAFATLQILMGSAIGTEVRGNSEVQKSISDLGPWLLMKIVMDTVNRQLIPDLIDFNFPFPAAGGYPKLTFGAVSNQEILEQIQVVTGAQQLGITPSKKYYAKAWSIQQADPNDPTDALQPPAAASPFGGFGGGGMPGMGGIDPAGGGSPAMLGPSSDPFGGAGGAVSPFAEGDYQGPFQGPHGGTYWLKQGAQDTPGNRVYSGANPGARSKAYQVRGQATAAVRGAVQSRIGETPGEAAQRSAVALARASARTAGAAARIGRALKGVSVTAGVGRAIEREATRKAARAGRVADRTEQAGVKAGGAEAARLARDAAVQRFKALRRKYGLIPSLAAQGLYYGTQAAKKVGGLIATKGLSAAGAPLGYLAGPAKTFLSSVVSPVAWAAIEARMKLATRNVPGLMTTQRNPDAPAKVATRWQNNRQAVAERRQMRGEFQPPVYFMAEGDDGVLGYDHLDFLAELRSIIDEDLAADGREPLDLDDDALSELVADLVEHVVERLSRVQAEAFGEDMDYEEFAAAEWTQIEGGKWRSSGGRVLTDPVYQRMKAGRDQAAPATAAATAAPASPPPAPPAAVERPAPVAQPEPASAPQKTKAVRYEAGRVLTPAEREEVLRSVTDRYKEAKLAKSEIKGYHRDSDDPIMGYPHSPEHFLRSDITGSMLRHYIRLPDGRVAHPTELFPQITKAVIDRHLAEQEAMEREAESRAKAKDARTASTKGDANDKYKQTNRSIEGSYLAQHSDGRIVRVDEKDPEDVSHYDRAGFKRITQTVAAPAPTPTPAPPASPPPAPEQKPGLLARLFGRGQAKPPAPEQPAAGGEFAPPAQPAPGRVYQVDPQQIAVDPGRFQFKLNTDAKTGVGNELKAARTWNPELGGLIAVWKDPADGKTYVVNGHHRLDLAKRSNAADVSVRYLTARDAGEARAKGALINIAEGRGTAVDAAKFLRDSGRGVADLEQAGVSLTGPVARDADLLTRLDPDLFRKVAAGGLEVEHALGVAKHLPDHLDQRKVLGMVQAAEDKQGRPMPRATVEALAREYALAPKVQSTQGSLFGPVDDEDSTYLSRAELKSYVRNELAKEAKDFRLGASVRRASALGAVAGNQLNTLQNRKIAERAEDSVDTFDRQAHLKGPLSDLLNRYAVEYTTAGAGARPMLRAKALAAVREALAAGDVQPREAAGGGKSPGLFG